MAALEGENAAAAEPGWGLQRSSGAVHAGEGAHLVFVRNYLRRECHKGGGAYNPDALLRARGTRKWSDWVGSNHRPLDYQSSTLTS